MSTVTCDRCGRPLPSGGRHLHSATPVTIANLVGIYDGSTGRRLQK